MATSITVRELRDRATAQLVAENLQLRQRVALLEHFLEALRHNQRTADQLLTELLDVLEALQGRGAAS